MQGRTHLLFYAPAKDAAPDCFLVTINERMHGPISFASRAWISDGVRPISVSLRGQRYEAMVLMTSKDWIDTGLGRWIVGEDCRSLVLDIVREGGQS
jgi:hypothetical protein